MKSPTFVRYIAGIGCLGAIAGAGHFATISGIRQAYFPSESNIAVNALAGILVVIAIYLLACVRRGRFVGITGSRASNSSR